MQGNHPSRIEDLPVVVMNIQYYCRFFWFYHKNMKILVVFLFALVYRIVVRAK